MSSHDEEKLLRSVVLQNANSILVARQRAEEELVRAKESLELKTQELAHSLSMMRATLESTNDGILVTDESGRITDFNEKFVQMWGLSAEIMALGEHRLLLEQTSRRFHDPEAFLLKINEIYALSPREVFDVLQLADGRIIERYSRTQYLQERKIGRVWSFRDISEYRKAEEAIRSSHERFTTIFNQAAVGMAVAGLDRRFERVNDRFAKILGYTVSEMTGMTFLEMTHPDDLALTQLNVQRLLCGEIRDYSHEKRFRRKDGSIVWSLTSVTLLRDGAGEPERFIGVIEDVTSRKQAEEAVRRSEAELRTLANSIPQLAWMADPDGYIFWYNHRWFEYTGTSFEEMKGWGWQSVHDPQMLPLVMEAWKHSVATGEPFELEFPIRGADGTFRWFLTRVNPSFDAENRVVRWFGTNTDVDQVKHIEQTLRDQTRTLELLNEAGTIVGSTLDLEKLLQAVTDIATQLSEAKFGAFFYNTIDERGESFLLYALSGAPREAFEKFGHPRATSLFGPTFHGEGPIRSADVLQDPRYGQMGPHYGLPTGHLPVRSYLAVPVVSRTGEVIGGLFFGHPEPDVFSENTERIIVGVATQAAIAIDNARLYEDIKNAAEEREQLLQAERSARSEAERASMMKDEFLATLSHELRTPLNAILGWSQLLATGKLEESDVKKGLEAIERNARAQTQLIEDLLDMSRIVSGKVRIDVQWTDLASVIDLAVDSVRPSAEAKNIRLRTIIDPKAGSVSGDPTRLQQIVWNLLTNAIKFTPKSGSVNVVLERVNSHLEITVHDSGIGIKPEFLPLVFERFRQADSSTTRSYGGLGLGLSIVKNLVELHGGTIHAKSEGEGKGATFTVNLPLAPIRSGGRREHPANPGNSPSDCKQLQLSGVKVLVVDDEPDARELIKRVLSQCEAEVTTAQNAEEGLRLVREQRPDVLVSDIGMPEKDGYQFIREVRKLRPDDGGRTPAIALTAFARSEDRTRAMIAGYQVHISKPIEPQELIATVGSLAGRTDPSQ